MITPKIIRNVSRGKVILRRRIQEANGVMMTFMKQLTTLNIPNMKSWSHGAGHRIIRILILDMSIDG